LKGSRNGSGGEGLSWKASLVEGVRGGGNGFVITLTVGKMGKIKVCDKLLKKKKKKDEGSGGGIPRVWLCIIQLIEGVK